MERRVSVSLYLDLANQESVLVDMPKMASPTCWSTIKHCRLESMPEACLVSVRITILIYMVQ